MESLQQHRKSRVTLTEIAEATGIHRKIVSRVHNRPGASVKGETIDRLVQFFFEEFVRYARGDLSPREIMARVVGNLLMVYPDDDAFLRDVLLERQLPSPKAPGKVAGRLRCKAATSLWMKFESLSKEEREARCRELLDRRKRDKPKAKRRKANIRRTAKGSRLLG
jgi:hypothetical protein